MSSKALTTLISEGVAILNQVREGTLTCEKYSAVCERYTTLSVVVAAVCPRIGASEIDEVHLIKDYLPTKVISPKLTWILSRKLKTSDPQHDLQVIIRKLAYLLSYTIPRRLKLDLLASWEAALPLKESDSTSSVGEVIETAQPLNAAIRMLVVNTRPLPYLFWNPENFLITQEELLVHAARQRSLLHVTANPSIVVEGVALCNSAVVTEMGNMTSTLTLISDSCLPQLQVPGSGIDLFSRTGAGLVAANGASNQRSYYLQAYSAFAINPRLYVGIGEDVSIPSSLISVEWRKGIWETSLAAQASTVIVGLQKEDFAIPIDVWSPTSVEEKGYEKEPIASLSTLTRLTSPWAKTLHNVVVEIREDLHSAMMRRPASCVEGKDVAGQWQAARNVIEVCLGVTSMLVAAICNSFHSRVDRFTHSETNLLPFLLCISDLFTFATLHFESPATHLLLSHRSDNEEPTTSTDKLPKINCEDLVGVLFRGGFAKGIDCNGLLTKIAVQIGIGLDKIRSDIVKICRNETASYCYPSKQKEELAWGNDPTYRMCSLMTNLVHPVVKVAQRIVPEVGASVLAFTVTSVVESLVDMVREHLVSTAAPLVPSETEIVWPIPLPQQVASEHLILTSLWNDLTHLAGYLNLRASDLQLTELPCWNLPSTLLQQLKAESPQ